jgi:hypothetical protein
MKYFGSQAPTHCDHMVVTETAQSLHDIAQNLSTFWQEISFPSSHLYSIVSSYAACTMQYYSKSLYLAFKLIYGNNLLQSAIHFFSFPITPTHCAALHDNELNFVALCYPSLQ